MSKFEELVCKGRLFCLTHLPGLLAVEGFHLFVEASSPTLLSTAVSLNTECISTNTPAGVPLCSTCPSSRSPDRESFLSATVWMTPSAYSTNPPAGVPPCRFHVTKKSSASANKVGLRVANIMIAWRSCHLGRHAPVNPATGAWRLRHALCQPTARRRGEC